MKSNKTKYALAFSLLTLAADSAVANVSSSVSVSSKVGKSNPARLIDNVKQRTIKQKKKFQDKHKKKVGYDTHSLSEFFRRLREEKES